MLYAYHLMPMALPAWLEFDNQTWDTDYLTPEQLASQGWLPLLYDPPGALLGYADPVQVGQAAIAYALATPEQEAAHKVANAKTLAHDLRRARRIEAELAGFHFAGHPIDSDRDSILRIANAAASAISALLNQRPWATAWRCADEHDLLLDAAGMLALQGALAMHGQQCHATSTAIAAQIEAADSVGSVEAIDLTAGWPSL